MPAKQSAVRHTNDENANKRVWAGTRCGNVTANRICSAVDCANLCRTRFPLPNRILRNKQNKRHARFSSTTDTLLATTYYRLLGYTRYLIGSGPDIFSPRSDSKGGAHLSIAPDTQDVSISDTEGILRARGRGTGDADDGENAVRRDRRKRKSGIPTCREDICVMKYPGDTAWPFSSTPGNAGKSKFHGYFHAFRVIFNVTL